MGRSRGANQAVPPLPNFLEQLGSGAQRIVQKVGEESVELVIAALVRDRAAVVQETADLIFHCLVVLSALGIHPREVGQELAHRRQARSKSNKG